MGNLLHGLANDLHLSLSIRSQRLPCPQPEGSSVGGSAAHVD
jgi:hypothetical protein